MTYALELARRGACDPQVDPERAYVACMTARDGYRRAMNAREGTKAWALRVDGVA